MKCKKCGAEINENSKFCSECGTPIDKEESKSGFLSKLFSDKKNIIIAILSVAFIILLILFIFGQSNSIFSNTNYDGRYTTVGYDSPMQVTIKDGKISITYDGHSFSKKYKYDESTDSIEASNDMYEFLLRKSDGDYYLGIDNLDGSDYNFGLSGERVIYLEGSKELEEAQEKIDNEESAKEQEKNENSEKASKFKGTVLAGDQYIVVGETLDPGIYSFAPVSGEDSFDIDVFDNIDYYNQRENNEGSDYVNHYENYYGDEVVEGIALRDGMVIDVGYDGVQYKKQ